MKKISLSKITVALSLCYATQFTYADIVSANGQTQISRQNGVKIINIAKPNEAGLSHNQYNKFNVDQSGVVLNNAVANSKTQLAGNVAANPNLRQQSAKVILNEVVSRDPSRIAGKQEIAGQRADYVLANPNGISVEGGGFINTGRASLVVGKPTIEKGNLTGYKTDGDKALTTKGKVSGASNLDLIAPTVNVAGNLEANNGTVNIISGRNEVKRDQDGKLTVNVLPAQGRVLDGKVAGSIQAGRIRIHSTDDRSTLEVSSADLKAKEVVLTAGNAKVAGTVSTQKSQNSKVNSSNTGAMQGHTLTTSEKQSFKKTTIQADTLVVGVSNNLDISGADIQAKEAAIIGGKTNLGAVKTKDQNVTLTQRHQGKTQIREREVNSTETAHRTTIKADTLKIASTKDKLTASAAKLDAKNLGLHGEKGTEFKGVVTTSIEETLSNTANSRKTAQKTGFGNSNATKQTYNAAELNVENTLVTTGDSAKFAGVQANVGGDFVAKNNGKLQFTSEVTTTVRDNKQHGVYNTGVRNQRVDATYAERVNQGSNFDVKGATLIEANNGVLISGSRVVSGKDGLVQANNGGLELKAVHNVQSGMEQSRQNLKRTEKFISQTSSQGASVASDSNLKVTSNKDVRVVGSSIKAAGLLDVAALGNIDVAGATSHSAHGSNFRGPRVDSKIEAPKIWLDNEGLISATIDTAHDLVIGDLKPAEVPKKVANDVKDSIKLKGEASATIGHLTQEQRTSISQHSAAELSGGNVNANANKALNVAGSQITATANDLNIKAQKVNTTAQNDEIKKLDSKTSVGLTNTLTVTENSVTHKALLGVQHKTTEEKVSVAQASRLTAKQDVNVNADTIKHQGTALTAGNNVVQTAKQIENSASQNRKEDWNQYVNAGISLTSTVSKAGYKGTLALEANGGHEAAVSTTANPTTINAGGNVVSKADRIQDQGTQYQAGKAVNLTSQRHDITSAHNTQSSNKLDAGVNLGVTVATPNFATGTAGVNLGIHYQNDKANASQAQKANLQGQNINIQTGKLNSQADMNATQDVNINAQKVTLSQSQNTSSNQGAGFNLGVGVGAIAIPGGGVPSVDFKLDVNKKQGQAIEAVPHTVQGHNVAINGQDNVILQGTNVQAVENATITGNKVSIATAHSVKKENNVNVGLGFNLGANASSLGVNGNVNVNKENSHLNPAVSVNAQNVNIQAQNGVHLTGVNSNSTNLTLDSGKGNVNLNSAQNQVNKTNVGASLALNGGLSGSKWKPEAGSASLNVETVRNETHSTTALNTQNATINGKVNAKPVVDKINEVSVGLSASGSGKFQPYPITNVAAIKKDWNNGTVAGVSADVAANVGVNKQTVIKPTGVNPAAPQVVNQQNFSGKVEATTALKAKLKQELMMELMKQQTQKSRRAAQK